MNLAKIIRTRYVLLTFIFIFIGVFTFLSLQNTKQTDAVSTTNFDPGNIISDYVMSNYNSMTEAEIQAFLKSKNNCNDTNLSKARVALRTYHVENGHYVCLADDLFPETYVSEPLGLQPKPTSGETAAHIIWQAAQDYKINPQVLIVLLQKEQSLITDTWPTTLQYRSATGYGCPDTAACDSKYYGFKNQVRNAASLFRTVLNGGWTNYPLGDNYIQYNPSASCGGTTVNIKNLATSALYRYTPYQPNSAALSSGYGTGNTCSSYGNRNFYLYFNDWFGDSAVEKIQISNYSKMVQPRLFFVPAGATYIQKNTNLVSTTSKGIFLYFIYSGTYDDTKLCLATSEQGDCYLYNKIQELTSATPEEMSNSRRLLFVNQKYVDINNAQIRNTSLKSAFFTKKTYLNGQLCLYSEDIGQNNCVLYANLQEIQSPQFFNMQIPRKLKISNNAHSVFIKNGFIEKSRYAGTVQYFSEVASWMGETCLKIQNDTTLSCIPYSELEEANISNVAEMIRPRRLSIKDDARYINLETLEKVDIDKKTITYFSSSVYINGSLCLLPENKEGFCIAYRDLQEISDKYSTMAQPRTIAIKNTSGNYYTSSGQKLNQTIDEGQKLFTEKTTVNNELCLRAKDDTINNIDKCIKYKDLDE